MAGNPKRASMREGPLAALFRRTEEEGLHGEGRAPELPTQEPAEGGVQRAETQPETPPRKELRPAPPSARGPEGLKRADGLHGVEDRVDLEPAPRHIPTPEERLRH